jgi:hypothetical protein
MEGYLRMAGSVGHYRPLSMKAQTKLYKYPSMYNRRMFKIGAAFYGARHFPHNSTRPSAMMSTSLRSVFVRAPKGHLGLEIAPAKENTLGYVWVKSVDPSGPLVGKVFDGDLIARVCIDETYGLDIHAVSDLFLKSTDSHDRFLICCVLLRVKRRIQLLHACRRDRKWQPAIPPPTLL